MAEISPAVRRASRERVGAHARPLLLSQAGRVALQLVSVAVLSRLLSPSDFGVVAIVGAVLAVAGVLGDVGMSLTAIREEELSAKQWSTLFWLNAVFGACVSTVVVLASGWIARAMGAPDVAPFLRVSASVFVLNGCGVQYRVQLNRDRRFSALGGLELGAPAIALAIGVTIALVRPGPWALIAQQVSAAAMLAIFSVALVRRRPGLPKGFARVRHIAVSGGALSLGQVANAVANNAAVTALGRSGSASSVGEFARADQLIRMPHAQLAASLTRVVVPSLASAYRTGGLESQIERARAAYGYSVGLASALLGGTAAASVPLIMGGQWAGTASTVVTVLSMGQVLNSLVYVFYWGFVAVGRAHRLLRLDLPAFGFFVVASFVVASRGPVAVAVAYAISMVLRSVLYAVLGLGDLKLDRRRFLRRALPNLFALYAVLASGALAVRLLEPVLGVAFRALISLTAAMGVLALGAVTSSSIRSEMRVAWGVFCSVVNR